MCLQSYCVVGESVHAASVPIKKSEMSESSADERFPGFTVVTIVTRLHEEVETTCLATTDRQPTSGGEHTRWCWTAVIARLIGFVSRGRTA